MDQKSWLWKKRSTEKTLVADKGNNSIIKNEEVTEIQKLQTDKAELERDLRTLEGKLCSALSECSAKDNVAKKQVKIAEEAIAGWERAEIQANSLKQELENILRQKASSEERIHHLDAALKECMQQLRFLRDEQEKRVHGAVIKTTEAFEKVRIASDEKLAEACRKLAKLEGENAQLVKSLLGKDKVIEDLSNYRTRLEADFNSLMSRVEATEKENASLKYEVCVLEKELDIRNEEREFNRRTVEVSQKQHVENAKKIGKLEMECQRLRVLVRKRLPGPAMLAKMKSEIEVLGKHQVEVTPQSTNKRIDILTQQLHKMEEENKTLKNTLIKTDAQVEAPNKHPQFLPERSPEVSSDVGGSDDKASCAESWASALISELEHFKNEKHLGTTLSYRSMGTSEIDLMDDFAEMEKIAIASSDCPSGSSQKSSQHTTVDKAPQCLSDLLKMLLDHSLALQRNPQEVLEDLKLALDESESKNGSKKSKLPPTATISIHKIVDLVEGLNMQSQNNQDSENTAGFIVRAFQWKTGELSAVLQELVLTCNNLLNGTADLEHFSEQVAYNLEWVVNHCFSIQDVSSMKDAIRSRFDWDELMSDGEVECNNNTHVERKNESLLADNLVFEPVARSEIANDNCIGIHSEEQETMLEDLDARVLETNNELKKACEKITHLEDELESKSSLCKRLEETCQELNTKLERMTTSKEIPENGKQSELQIETDWEITAASEKLAECQETILNLGKQLKALASPSEAPLFDKFMSNTVEPVSENASQRSSLLDKMLAEDKDDKIGTSPCPKPYTENTKKAVEPCDVFTTTNGIFNHDDKKENKTGAFMDIVPCKKKGGWSIFRKMFWRRKHSKLNKAPST